MSMLENNFLLIILNGEERKKNIAALLTLFSHRNEVDFIDLVCVSVECQKV